MSLSALSSAFSLSSLSDSGSKNHKRKESFRGEIFVSSFEASIDGSSISSESAKSIRQEAHLPTLLGGHDSATATGSSSGFPSLAHSGSSLSSNRSGPVLALTVSRASEALRELTDGIQQLGQENAVQNFERLEAPQQVVLLENVEYVSSLPHASSCTDLSTLDEPITKEMAKEVFSRRIVPVELHVSANQSGDISTLYGGKHHNVDYDDEEDNEEAHDIDVEQGQNEVATTVEVSFPWYQRYLGQRSRVELFFMFVIGISSSILILLLVVVLK